MEFAIQINVGQSTQEALESALETMQKHERGEQCVVSHLGVLTWKQFYIFTCWAKANRTIC